MNYYNDFDTSACEWLTNLIAAGLVPAGTVDPRSIADVTPEDVVGYDQCHFFAGIGGWSEALRLAGWPEDRPVWTGSCPCQGYSSAGKRLGNDDPRNLWPEWFRLIRECRPEFVFGEQVSAAIRYGWLDRVFADMEGEGYACGAVVLGAHSIGSPHVRQRIYWGAFRRAGVAQGDADIAGLEGRHVGRDGPGERTAGPTGMARGMGDADDRGEVPVGGVPRRPGTQREGSFGGLANSGGERRQQDARGTPRDEAEDGRAGRDEREPDGDHVVAGAGADRGTARGMADARVVGRERGPGELGGGRDATERGEAGGDARGGDGGRGHWSDFDLVYCRDGKYRRIPRQPRPAEGDAQPGLQPVADGVPEGMVPRGVAGLHFAAEEAFPLAFEKIEGRSKLLKGSGNAIVPPLAAQFILAFLESIDEL